MIIFRLRFSIYRLCQYDEAIARRRALARHYREALRDLEELALPPGPDGDPDHFDVFQNYEIEAADRDGLKAFLKSRGVGTLVQWGGKAVHQWKALGLRAQLPHTDALMERMLMLPMNPALSGDDVDYIASSIREFYRR